MARIKQIRLRAEQSGVKGFSPSQNRPYCIWDPPSPIPNGYPSYLPELKRPGRDVYHSTPYTAKLKNEWRYTYTSPTCLHCVGRGTFTFHPTYKMGSPIM